MTAHEAHVARPLLKVEEYDEVVVKVPRTHQEIVLAKVAYSVEDMRVFLGEDKWSREAVLRLIRAGLLRARHNGRRYIIPGAAIIEFLDGADEPMHHRDSA